MSPDAGIDFHGPYGFPRVSGDEPWADVEPVDIIWFSPRERG